MFEFGWEAGGGAIRNEMQYMNDSVNDQYMCDSVNDIIYHTVVFACVCARAHVCVCCVCVCACG